MSQIGRTVKNLEAPRPLKSTSRQTHHTQLYEVQSIEELITLTENVAASLASGHSNTESMTILSANLRSHGPQLEMISKDTLDRAFVTFRNASQDERLSIITRMNLLELIELRAKLWQNSDGINTYYKHKATDVQPDNNLGINDLSMLSTSPPAANALGQQPLILGPGELIRPSGKFTKPTKIPGKNYSKDEVVIRNADSGKVMGIKGRRVHMIEELSETIISFQRVNPGAKERLVQITGPNEDKINYAKSLIEDTIRRNASPVRLEAPQDGSCSSLASSISDEAISRANRNSVGAMIASGGGIGGIAGGAGAGGGGVHVNNYVPNQNSGFHNSNNNNTNAMIGIGGGGGIGIGIGGGGGIGVGGGGGGLHGIGLNNLNSKFSRNASGQLLLHSLSTNDASLGEYKYTVGIGHHTIKITGDCFELVRVAKLVLDDYFSSNEFLASVEAGATLDNSLSSSSLAMNASSIGGFVSSSGGGHHHPPSHQLISSSPFVDSGIGLNLMGSSSGPLNNISHSNNNNNNNNNNSNNTNNSSSIEVDDDVFIVENDSSSNSSSSNSTVTMSSSATQGTNVTASSSSAVPTNGLTRSRRSHFSRKESTPDTKDTNKELSNSMRIVHEYERLIFYAKSPHSWVLPRDWTKITEKHPTIIRNKNVDDESKRFDADKYLALVKSGVYTKIDVDLVATEESPEPE